MTVSAMRLLVLAARWMSNLIHRFKAPAGSDAGIHHGSRSYERIEKRLTFVQHRRNNYTSSFIAIVRSHMPVFLTRLIPDRQRFTSDCLQPAPNHGSQYR